MFRLVYISRQAIQFDDDDLVALLEQSREKNERLGITGLLLYRSGNFLQVLEGEQSAVQELFASIRDDKRHHRVVTVIEGSVTHRDFAQWTMAFHHIGVERDVLPDGFSDFLSDPWNSLEKGEYSESVRSFLRMFIRVTG